MKNNGSRIRYCPHCGERISGQGEYRQRRESTWTMIQAIVLFFILPTLFLIYQIAK